MGLSYKAMGFCLALVLAMGCTSQEVQKNKPRRQVTCKYWLQQCHVKARRLCSNGYSVVRSVRTDKVGGPHGAYKEYKMILTCD